MVGAAAIVGAVVGANVEDARGTLRAAGVFILPCLPIKCCAAAVDEANICLHVSSGHGKVGTFFEDARGGGNTTDKDEAVAMTVAAAEVDTLREAVFLACLLTKCWLAAFVEANVCLHVSSGHGKKGACVDDGGGGA